MKPTFIVSCKMLRMLLIFSSLLLITTFLFSENNPIIAWTESGKKVELYSNGTWKYAVKTTKDDWRNYVVFLDFDYRYAREETTREDQIWKEVQLFFQFMNATSKTITGLVYEVKYLDAFNDVVWTDVYKDNIIIKPTKSTEKNEYWYYTELKDAFRALKDSAMAGTLHVLLRMRKIAFQDGTIIEFTDGPLVEPKWKH